MQETMAKTNNLAKEQTLSPKTTTISALFSEPPKDTASSKDNHIEQPNEETIFPQHFAFDRNRNNSNHANSKVPPDVPSSSGEIAPHQQTPQMSSCETASCQQISKTPSGKAVSQQQISQIPTSQIIPNPSQPRKIFSEPSILKLADSIRQHGIIQPLTVRKTGHLYELIAGERRLRAAKELALSSVPCIIIETSEEKSAELAIIENLMREDLNIFEQASAIQTLIDTYSLTQEQVAEKLSLSQPSIANKLRLLRFTQEEKDAITSNQLTERHARALLRINDSELRKSALTLVAENSLNVSETEKLINEILSKDSCISEKTPKEPKQYKDVSSFYSAVKRAVDCAKLSNLGVKCRKVVGDSFTEITIILPNEPL